MGFVDCFSDDRRESMAISQQGPIKIGPLPPHGAHESLERWNVRGEERKSDRKHNQTKRDR